MARLIVEACSVRTDFEEAPDTGTYCTLVVVVSVSRADDGKAVTGLKPENFRVSASAWVAEDFSFEINYEWKWEPADVEPAGCYQLHIKTGPVSKPYKGERYVFGIQAQTFGKARPKGPRPVIDQGQTVFQMISTGE